MEGENTGKLLNLDKLFSCKLSPKHAIILNMNIYACVH